MSEEGRQVTEAAGGVVWRRSKVGVEVVLVYRESLRDWSLPKGSVEQGESMTDAALREVAEETGLACILGERLESTEWVRDDGTLRRAHWWLMRPRHQGVPRAGDSVTKWQWLPAGDALIRVSHERDRGLLTAGLGLIPAEDGSIRAGRMRRAGRACAAVLREGLFGTEILMVRHRDFWTLPGGGVDEDEASHDAALRELREETGLEGVALRELFDGCWLVETDPAATVVLGHDPELRADEQVLRGVAWFTLEEKHDDRQVSLVIDALGAARGGLD